MHISVHTTVNRICIAKPGFFTKLINRVANTFESDPALFPAKKGQKPPPIFPIKKLPPMSFLLYFYVVIFPMPTQNCKKSINSNSFPRFFFQMGQNGSKSARPKNFFPPHKSPKPPKTRQPATISHSDRQGPGNQTLVEYVC